MLTITILTTTGLLVAKQVYGLPVEYWVCGLPLAAGVLLSMVQFFTIKRMGSKMMDKMGRKF